jgi:hypothetical protein
MTPEFVEHEEKGISNQSEGEIDENGVFHCLPHQLGGWHILPHTYSAARLPVRGAARVSTLHTPAARCCAHAVTRRSFVCQSLGDARMYLSNQSLLVIIVVGVIAGWLAGKVVEGGGFAVAP